MRASYSCEVGAELAKKRVRIGQGHSESFGHTRIGDLALDDIEALSQRRIIAQSLLPTLVGKKQSVREGSIRERQRGGTGHATGHIRYAVVDHAVHHIRWILVCSSVDRLEATALIDRDIHDHGPLLHGLEVLPTDELWSLGTGDQNATNHQVGSVDLLQDVVPV